MSGWWFAAAAFLAMVVALWIFSTRSSRNLPRVGEAARGFSLLDQNRKLHRLDDFRGKWLVLYFYPRDDTPGCAEQAMRFRNSMRDLEALGAIVCGVSVDSSQSHAGFARKYNLPFTLLADATGEVAARYGSLLDLVLVRFARRNTFLIDPDGKVAKVYVGVSPSRNTQQVSDDLRTLAHAT